MKLALAVLSLLCAGESQDKTPYLMKGMQIEGCECDVYCPCIFSKDATGLDCRSISGWMIQEGNYGKTDLKGLVFAAALTKSGKNIEKAMGKWEGILYLPEKATEEQRKGIESILKEEVGGAFSKLEVKTADVRIACPTPDHHEVTIGKLGELKITGLKGANGQVPVIENAPSPVALPKTFCAKADVNAYNDGVTKWDFAGRNGFYGMFEMKSK